MNIVCNNTYVRIRICMHTYVPMYMYLCLCTYINTYVCMYVHTIYPMYVYVRIYEISMYMHMYVST